jgi:hypothetical protein
VVVLGVPPATTEEPELSKMDRALNGVEDNDNPWYDADVAWDRAETDPCERGTVGCSRRHTTDSECATW